MRKLQFSALILSFFLLCSLCGCGAASSKNSAMSDSVIMQESSSENGFQKADGLAYEMPAESPQAEEAAGGTYTYSVTKQSGVSIPADGRKIIRSADLQVETTDFEQSLDAVEKVVSETGGYIQSARVDGASAREVYGYRSANYVLRIPAEKLDTFLSGASSIGSVLSSFTSNEEITEQYFDTEARLATLKVQQERLLAILEKAESLTDVITLEQALSDVLYEIESLTGTLRKYDGMITYSTVELSLQEVYTPTSVPAPPKNLSERVGQAFDQSLRSLRTDGENLIVWLAANGIALLLWILLIVILLLIVRSHLRKVQRKKSAAANAYTPVPSPEPAPVSPENPETKPQS